VGEANRKLATLIARKHAADAQRSLSRLTTEATAPRDFAKFDRLSRRVDAAEAEAQAWSELCDESPDDELWTPDTDANIEAQLQTLRAETNIPAC
jgi:phage shock protein A